jgi:hypothetical protein
MLNQISPTVVKKNSVADTSCTQTSTNFLLPTVYGYETLKVNLEIYITGA